MVVNRIERVEDEKRKLGSHVLLGEGCLEGQNVGSATVSFGI